MGQVIAIQSRQEYVTFECWVCGVLFAITENVRFAKQRDDKTLFCPNGCRLGLGESEESKLRKKLEHAERLLAAERERAATNYTEREKAEKALRRLKKRTAAGVCPVQGCKRTCTDLARHIETKHPDYKAEAMQP